MKNHEREAKATTKGDEEGGDGDARDDWAILPLSVNDLVQTCEVKDARTPLNLALRIIASQQ
jgi:hypothetical protein